MIEVASVSPDEVAHMTQMQEEQQFDSFRFTEENGVPRGRLRLKVLQVTIILKPKPAE